MKSWSLIPRKILFGNPNYLHFRLNSLGTQLAFIAPLQGILNIWLSRPESLENAHPLTKDIHRGIRSFFWSYDNQHIIYSQDKDGDENWRLYQVHSETGEEFCLTPEDNVQARVEKISPLKPDLIMISLNNRIPEYHDLYLLNLKTKTKDLVFQNDFYSSFYIDNDLELRFVNQDTLEGGYQIKYKNGDEFLTISPEDCMATHILGFNGSNSKFYMQDSRHHNTAALVEIDIKTKLCHTLAHDPLSDLTDVLFHPKSKNFQAFASTTDRKKWQYFDQDIEKSMVSLRSLQKGDIEVVSRALDDKHWIVAFLNDDQALSYYFFDQSSNKAIFLAFNRQDLDQYKLVSMSCHYIPTRDGLSLNSYLSKPEADIFGQGPYPLILLVHGGPQVRDHWGFSPYHQLLANRGYAVLSVNYRGSTGFGKILANAGNGEWGGKAHDDLIDAVEWAISENMTERHKIAIMGGSYGGYATLVGMTMTPDIFACGIDIVGPSNLVTLISSVPPYWKAALNNFKYRLGADFDTEEGRKFLLKRSPLTYVDHIKKPLLIAQGANDPRVKQAESDQIVAAMKEKNIPVTYVLFPDEGHGFARPENSLAFMGIVEKFLERHLGGKCEISPDELRQSSAQIQEF